MTIFYMNGCPYCKNARKALDDLKKEDKRYEAVPIEWIDENANPERTKSYDYYYVPSVFNGKEKLYEAHPGDDYTFIRSKMKEALEAAL